MHQMNIYETHVPHWRLSARWMLKRLWIYLKLFNNGPPTTSLLIIKLELTLTLSHHSDWTDVETSIKYTIIWCCLCPHERQDAGFPAGCTSAISGGYAVADQCLCDVWWPAYNQTFHFFHANTIVTRLLIFIHSVCISDLWMLVQADSNPTATHLWKLQVRTIFPFMVWVPLIFLKPTNVWIITDPNVP